MKKLLSLPLLALLVWSCDNDFDVTAPWKEIPVVYGIVSPQDTAHYLRIEKAFIDPERSALEIAQIADSLYYPENSILVWLEQVSNANNRIQMQRVNGSLEGHPRAGGIFASEPNWLYKAKPSGGFSLLPGQAYRLVIERADGKPDVTAQTTVPSPFTIIRPLLSEAVPRISFAGQVVTTIRWRTDANGYFFNVTLRVRINERFLNGQLAESKTLVWEAAKNVERGETVVGAGLYEANAFMTGNSFYTFLAKNLQRPAANRYREFVSCDIIIDGGGREIKEYLETAEANGNLTGAETFPNYTNISEGYGVFTAKNQTIGESIRIDAVTVDSMNLSPIADTLGFIK